MARSIRVQLDDAADAALEILRETTGADNDSVVVSRALADSARRSAHRPSLRAEAEALAADPADLEEVRRVRAFLDGETS